MATKKEANKIKAYKINVVLDGFSNIMFNRFYDHSKEVRPAEQKTHLNPNDRSQGFCGSTPFYIHLSGGRTKLGSLSIKQEAQPRPVLKLPWRLSFTITLLDNAILDPMKLENWFNECGITVALGAHRPRFGRFQVKEWKVM